jgi:subtilisin family serine protease
MESLILNILKTLLITAILATNAYARQVKIAVIDTGYTKPINFDSVNLCDSGHFDATTDKEVVGLDSNFKNIQNHGTHVAHIIDDKLRVLGKNKYCLVIFKIYGEGNNVVESSIKALKRIKNSDIRYVNYSTAGEGYYTEEYQAIKDVLNRGVKIFAAAGNRSQSLDLIKIYPAMYDSRIFVVGNGMSNQERFFASNYGSYVKYWVNGMNILAGGYVKSGTSQAAAIFSSRYIYDNIIMYGQ